MSRRREVEEKGFESAWRGWERARKKVRESAGFFFLLVGEESELEVALISRREGAERCQRARSSAAAREDGGTGGGGAEKGRRNNGSNRLFSRRASVRERDESLSVFHLSFCLSKRGCSFTARTFSAGVAVAALDMAGEERHRERSGRESFFFFFFGSRSNGSERAMQGKQESVMKGRGKKGKKKNIRIARKSSRFSTSSVEFHAFLKPPAAAAAWLDTAGHSASEGEGNGRQQARSRGCGRRRRGGASRDLICHPSGGGRRCRYC